MAVLELNHGTIRSADEGRVANLLGNLRGYIARRALYKQTVRELAELSGRELADLGISRSMIRSVAYDAAWNSK